MTSGRAEARLLWITERYPPTPGGMAASCARQVRGLRSRGVSLDLVALGGAGEDLEVRVRAREGGADLLLPRRVSRGILAQRVWQMVQERHARQAYTGVVGFGANFPGYLAVTLAAWLGVEAVSLVRGNDLDRDWFDPRRAYMVHECLARSRAIGAVSTDKVRQIRSLFPEQAVEWIPNGVAVARWELLGRDREVRDRLRRELAGDGRRVVGLFGELKPKKRVPFWLAALRDRGLMDRLGLLVVGQVDPETEAILADRTLTPHVVRLPFLAPEELPGHYAACDFLALPSMFEGLPNVLLESMACGVIPLCSQTGGMPDVVEDGATGFLFPPENARLAGEAMERALALEPEARAAMARRGQEHVRDHFSEARELDALEDLLRFLGPAPEDSEGGRK